MGFFSILGSAISSAVSTVAGGISRGLSALGSALSSFAGSAVGIIGKIATKASAFMGLLTTLPLGPLGPILGPIIGQLILKVVAKGIEYLAKKLGIINDKDRVEEVGYRVEEAQQHEDWKKQDDPEFATFQDYYEYLKKKIPDEKIDYAKIKENRNRYMVIGTMELTKGVEEIKGIQLPEDFLFEIGRSRMETDEIQAIVDAFKELGYGSVMVSDYFKGKLSREESKRVESALLANMKKYYPSKDDDALHERLGVMRMASRNDSKLEDVYSDKLTKENMEKIAKDPKYVEDL